MYPEIFGSPGPFDNAFELNNVINIDREKLQAAHHLLRPLMLRRVKTEVEKLLPPKFVTKITCPLSRMQVPLVYILDSRERKVVRVCVYVCERDHSGSLICQRVGTNSLPRCISQPLSGVSIK